MFSRCICTAIGVASLIVLRAAAMAVPEPDIDKLVAAANLIVLGELVTVERGNNRTIEVNRTPLQVRADHGVLRIDDLIGGTARSPVRFEILVPSKEAGWQVPRQQVYGLFFLRTGDSEEPSLADKYYSYIPVPRGINARGDTPLERVISILAETLLMPNNRSLSNQAVLYLQLSRSKAANNALRVALDAATDPELRIKIANASVFQGDTSSLKVIKQLFLADPRITVSDRQQEVLGNVMAVHLKDPAAIPDLEELLGAPSVYIRRGVAGALRKTESPLALNGLRRALADPDSDVRYYGVLGLAGITDGDTKMVPHVDEFKANESKYLSYWRERPAKRELQTSPRNQQ